MILDTFAGPGGWSAGLSSLGLVASELGIEWDADACATRRLNGYRTIRADVATVPLEPLAGRVSGLIASPPCQAFSKMGNRSGVAAIARYRVHALRVIRSGWVSFTPGADDDVRAGLVLEPIRYVDALRPQWVALEQVPAVLPVWQVFAVVLESWGYHTAVAKVNAADYGAPQTRERAVLLARRDTHATIPRPTHGPRRKAPHVTMAEALPELDGDWLADRRNDQSGSGEVEADWPYRRPATTIAGRGIVGDPGSNANRFNGRHKSRNDGFRITVEEAAALQSFPSGYRWAGSSTSRYQQVGNAVPPRLAAHLLASVLDMCPPEGES